MFPLRQLVFERNKSSLYEYPSPEKIREIEVLEKGKDEYKLDSYILPNVRRKRFKTRSICKRSSINTKRLESALNYSRPSENLRNSLKIQTENTDLNVVRRNFNNSSCLIMSNRKSKIQCADQSNCNSSKESLQIPSINSSNKNCKYNRNNHNISVPNKHTRNEGEGVNIVELLYQEQKINFKEDIEKIIRSPQIKEFIKAFK